jgi:hypothetical protein
MYTFYVSETVLDLRIQKDVTLSRNIEIKQRKQISFVE